MSLYKRKDSSVWWVKLHHCGKIVQRSTGTTDKAKAQEYHDRLKAQLWQQSKLGAKSVHSWQESVLRFIQETSDKRSHEQDLHMLRWLDSYLGHLSINDITLYVIDGIRQARLEGRSRSTVNRYLSVIRAILLKARDEWQWLDTVPKVKLYKEPQGRVRFLTQPETQALLQELSGFPYLQDMVIFTLSTGLRHANVLELEWSKVSLEKSHMWVSATASKNGKPISVPLNQQALQVLYRQVGKHPTRVFTNKGNTVYSANSGVWTRALERAAITDFRWHDLRHTWASNHVMAGTPINELQQLGGWSSLRMVERYAHLSSEHLAKAASRLDSVNVSYVSATVSPKVDDPVIL